MKDVRELAEFTASGKVMRLVMDIAAALERYKLVMEGPEGVRLRKLNRVKTIRGTTAIEGNTLTEEQVTAILSGRRVAGSKREIAEVKGAYAAYAAVEKLNPLSAKDLLKAHSLLTADLVDRPGRWRTCNVGVFSASGKAKGVPKGGKKKVVRKGGKKTADRVLELVAANSRITFAEMVAELGISRSAIQKHIAALKDAQRLRRIGPDKGGHWEVVK